MGNIYSGNEKGAYDKIPILSCELWEDLYPTDGIYFC